MRSPAWVTHRACTQRARPQECALPFSVAPPRAHPPAKENMNDLFEVLLSWAVMLTGYSMPAQHPEVVMASHATLEQMACEGRRCRVMGWYPSGGKIYIDDSLDLGDLYASSIVVHEMVHY